MEQRENDRPTEGGGVSEKDLPTTKPGWYVYNLGTGTLSKVQIPDPARHHKIAIPLPEKGAEDLQITFQGHKVFIRNKVSGVESERDLPPDIHVCGRRCPIAHVEPFSPVQPFKFDQELQIHILKSFDNSPTEGIKLPVTFDVASLPRTISVETSEGGGAVQKVEGTMPEPKKLEQEFATRAQDQKPEPPQEASPAWSFDKMLAQYDAAVKETRAIAFQERKEMLGL